MWPDALIKELAEKERAGGEAQCRLPTVFMSQSDGYARWKAFAEAQGRGAEWLAWKEDESCPQRDVAPGGDREAPHEWTNACSLDLTGDAASCTDAMEPNDLRRHGEHLTPGQTVRDLRICRDDKDFFYLPAGGTVKITFTHSDGDLISGSAGALDSEEMTVPAESYVYVTGYQGATNTYTLSVR